MTIPLPAPRPAEADKRKLVPLDFSPTCDLHNCELRAARAVQCNTCREIVAWYCTPHAARIEARYLAQTTKTSHCDGCGTKAPMHELTSVLSIAGWF